MPVAPLDAARLRGRETGAAAVEFALVFPLLFLLIYGIIVYSYVFVLQESINYAAQEAAEAAVAVAPNPNHDATVEQRVRATAVAVLEWLPDSQKARVLGSGGQKVQVQFIDVDGTSAVRVTLSFEVSGGGGGAPLFPVITLPFVGKVPVLPQQLVASAVARI